MAKKSQRRRNQVGCMWGFIRMFDFGHRRSAQKLLVDRRHGSKRSTGVRKPNETSQETSDCQERRVAVDVSKPNVKKLIEEELFTEQEKKKQTLDGELEQVSDSELEGRRTKNQRKKNRTGKRSCDNFSQINAADHPESEVHCNRKHRSARSLDIDSMIGEFRCEIHQRNASCMKHDRLDQKLKDKKERLSELIKFLISQKLLHGDRPREDSEILTSKDLMEVFEILGSDEELFLKLLHDPNLLVSKDVLDLQNGQREKQEEIAISFEGENQTSVGKSNLPEKSDVFVNRKQRGFFRRKTKPQERNPYNESESSEKIVILKPGPFLSPEMENRHMSSLASHSTRISSHLFLAEIKRKLKYAIGKEQRGKPSDRGTKEGFRKSVPTKEHFFIERMARPSMVEKKGMEHESGNSKQRQSNIYIEARKHLCEMLKNEDIDPNFPSKQITRKLGRILSLPEYLSPLGSPIRKEPISSSSTHKRSASAKFHDVDEKKKENLASPQITQNSVSEPFISDNVSDNTVESLQTAPSNPVEENDDRMVEASSIDEAISAAGNFKTTKPTGMIIEEEPEQFSSSTTRSHHSDDNICEPYSEDRHEVLKLDSLEESQPSSSLRESQSYSVTKSEECQESASDLAERSSPISVLEPLFSDEVIKRTKIRFPSVETQPLCIEFEEKVPSAGNQSNITKTSIDDKESVFEYVKAVLNALNMNWEEVYMKSVSSVELLEPSLINNVQFFPSQLCSNHELLLDCINEVLLEFCGYQFGSSPWVSFIKPKVKPILNLKNIVHEVQEGVYLHLLLLPFPRALDQIVGKDMDRAGNWMDLRFDVDCIGIEMSEVILDELLEEIMS